MEKKSCFNCQHFLICKVRDRASEFVGWMNNNGCYLTGKFHPALCELMALLCYEYKQEEQEKKE